MIQERLGTSESTIGVVKAGLMLLSCRVFGAEIKDSSLGKLRQRAILAKVRTRQSMKFIVAASLKIPTKRCAFFGYLFSLQHK